MLPPSTPAAPAPTSPPTALVQRYRLRVDHEVLRLSSSTARSPIAIQGLIGLVVAGYFGLPDRKAPAAVWLLLVIISHALRLAFRPGPVEFDAARIRQAMRRHRHRVLYSAFAWGSGGFLLFDPANVADQLALTVVMVSTCIGFSFSASFHAPTLKAALPLLIGPIVLSLFLSPQPNMWIMGVVGTSFLLVMHRLIHERGVQLEESLTLRMQAQEAQEEKQRFFAAASHDLRQPLQALTLYQTVLARGAVTPDVIQRMGECIDALDRLLAGVLDIARLDAGKVATSMEAVYLPELMLRVSRLHDMGARDKELRLRLHTQDEWVRSDPVLLERILSNLLSNAMRYTERGGVLLAVRRRGERMLLQVFDTGIGIPDDQIESIFGEFTQLNNPQRDAARGAGLGLATVQRLARLLEHPLGVRSRIGRGSCFWLELPRCEAPPRKAVGAQSDGSSDHLTSSVRPPWRVLVVDDNAMVRESLQAMLTGWGLAVTVEAGSERALQRMKHEDFDAVISDWRLPGDMDGIEVLRQARSLTRARLTALLTGDNLTQPPPDMMVITKPVRALRLRALLEAELGKPETDHVPP